MQTIILDNYQLKMDRQNMIKITVVVEKNEHDLQKQLLFETKIPKTSGYATIFSFLRWSQIFNLFRDWGNVSYCILIF